MKDLVIIGATILGREVITGIDRINQEQGPTWNLLGFVDEERTGEVAGVKVLGKLEDFLKMDKSVEFFVAERSGHERERIAKICKAAGFAAATIVDVDGRKGVNWSCGEGTYMGYKTYIAPQVKIGDFCVIERGSVIGHDTVVGDYSSFAPSASLGGDSVIGKYTTLGHRCTIINMVNTPDNCEFATGSCVIKNTPQSGYYAGVPAKLVRPYEEGDAQV